MHTLSLPPTDRDETPVTNKKAEILGTFKTEGGRERRIFACNTLLRQKLIDMRDQDGSPWSNAKFATKFGVNVSVVSQYLNERGCIYDGDIARLERSADDFLRNEERRRLSGIETAPCDIVDQMLTAFEYIRKTNDLGVIVAESGEGKTRGIELIQKSNVLAMLFHVRAWSSDKNSLQSALWDVIPHVGYDPQTKRASFLVTSLRGSDRPLIVDDAHKLTRPALHLLFDLYDETNIPICLIGTDELVLKLEDDPQRFSRVGIHWAVKPGEKDRRKLITHQIKSIAQDVNGELDELRDLCERVCTQHGHFRSVEKQLKLASEIKHGKNKDLTWCQAFRQAHTLLLRQYQLQ